MPSKVNKPVVNVGQRFSQDEKSTARKNIDVYSTGEVDEKLDALAKKHLDMRVDSDVVEFFMMEA